MIVCAEKARVRSLRIILAIRKPKKKARKQEKGGLNKPLAGGA